MRTLPRKKGTERPLKHFPKAGIIGKSERFDQNKRMHPADRRNTCPETGILSPMEKL